MCFSLEPHTVVFPLATSELNLPQLLLQTSAIYTICQYMIVVQCFSKSHKMPRQTKPRHAQSQELTNLTSRVNAAATKLASPGPNLTGAKHPQGFEFEEHGREVQGLHSPTAS